MFGLGKKKEQKVIDEKTLEKSYSLPILKYQRQPGDLLCQVQGCTLF